MTQKGVVGMHSWLPYDKSISNYFTFDRDSTLLNSKYVPRTFVSRVVQKITGPALSGPADLGLPGFR